MSSRSPCATPALSAALRRAVSICPRRLGCLTRTLRRVSCPTPPTVDVWLKAQRHGGRRLRRFGDADHGLAVAAGETSKYSPQEAHRGRIAESLLPGPASDDCGARVDWQGEAPPLPRGALMYAAARTPRRACRGRDERGYPYEQRATRPRRCLQSPMTPTDNTMHAERIRAPGAFRESKHAPRG